MLARTTLAALLLGVAFSGCISDEGDVPDVGDVVENLGAGPLYNATGGLFAATEPLYRDPQNTPHPSFNFPTLTWPAAGADVPALWRPINGTALPATLTSLQLVKNAGVGQGAGIALFGSLAVVPGYGASTTVLNISEPARPIILSSFYPQEGMANHRGAAFIPYPTGQLVVVISTGSGIDVWDLTDPKDPRPLPPLVIEDPTTGDSIGSHKVGVVPGTPIVVNAASDGQNRPVNQMFDLSDPYNAFRLPDFENGYSCHHIYFWNDRAAEKYRGVCAGIQATQLWDMADPYHPSVIVTVPFGTGGTPAEGQGSVVFPASLSHYAGLSSDGSVLMMGDEWGGGGTTPPGCVARVDIPMVGSVSVPLGAVWFYDVSVETEPELLGWYSASQDQRVQGGAGNLGQDASCTAHHGRLVPMPDRDVLAMSFYGAGVVVIDFTDVRNEQGGVASTVAQFADGSNTWETWYYNGYLFTGDLARGMDVLKFSDPA